MRILLLLAAFTGLSTLAPASNATPPRCSEIDSYHDLDFWVGEWDVYSDGEMVGTNRIEKILDECAILEHWTGAGGGRGKSLFYVDDEGTWQQVWVTQRATAAGGVKEKTRQPLASDEKVRFQGVINRADGSSYLDRTTLTRLDDGTVRQLIEISTDGGQTWRATFDAIYRPAATNQTGS